MKKMIHITALCKKVSILSGRIKSVKRKEVKNRVKVMHISFTFLFFILSVPLIKIHKK